MAGKQEDKVQRALGTELELPEECVVDLQADFTFDELKASLEKAKGALLRHGVLRVKNILKPEHVAEFTRLFRIYYEETSVRILDDAWKPAQEEGESDLEYQDRVRTYLGYRFDDPSTHKNSQLHALHGIIKNCGIGVSEAMCYLRTLDQVCWLFSIIHGTDQLFCSNDGVCFFHSDPTLSTEVPVESSASWLHQDLCPQLGKRGAFGEFYGLQCQFTMTEGHHLRAVPGSHLMDMTELGTTNKHWFKPYGKGVPPPAVFDKPASCVVKGGAGDAILWFSNTVHSGTKLDRDRLTAYVCMHKKKNFWDSNKGRYATADLKRIQKVYDEGRTTSHNGNLNGVKNQTYGDPLLDIAFLRPREHGWKIFLQTADQKQRTRLEAFQFKNRTGLLGGYSSEPLVNILSLQEGKRRLQAEKKRAPSSELNGQQVLKAQRA